MTDLIFVSLENWDEIWRRNQFVCAELAKRYPDTKILFVALPKDLSHNIRHGRLRGLPPQATRAAPGFQNIIVTHPIKLLPNSIPGGRSANDVLATWHVRRVAKEMGIRRPILWLNRHDAVHMPGRMGEIGVVYDITDDWISLSQRNSQRQLVKSQDAELCRRADSVIVCSQKLFDLKRTLAREIYLVANGVNAEHYRLVLDGTGASVAEAAGWQRPVLGYTGTIHADRIDVDLIENIAMKMQRGSIVLVGPNMLPKSEQARLRECGNVFMPGPVPYSEIPNLMRAFDVCITPHRVTPFTESLNPIKLWEYLAAGKPIVSSPVAGFRDFPQLIRIAATADAFLSHCMDAVNEPADLPEARRTEARQHSWTTRVDQICGILEHLCDSQRRN